MREDVFDAAVSPSRTTSRVRSASTAMLLALAGVPLAANADSISVSNVTGSRTINEGQTTTFTTNSSVNGNSYDYFDYAYASISYGGGSWVSGSSTNLNLGSNTQSFNIRYNTPGTYYFYQTDYMREHYYSWGGGPYYDYYNSSTAVQSVTVLDVAPTIQSLTPDTSLDVGATLDFSAYATNPGGLGMTYQWDFDGSKTYGAFTGRSGSYAFSSPGQYTVDLLVSDGYGGTATGTFNVDVASPQVDAGSAVPLPRTASGGAALLGLAGAAMAVRARRRQAGALLVRND